MSNGAVVLDASALLALLQAEPGSDVVTDLLPGSVMSSVSLSEVVAKLTDHGLALNEVHAVLDGLPIDVRTFDRDAAFAAGELRGITRGAGLSLGDRACLALAMRLELRAVTADRAWTSVSKEIADVVVIR